MPDITMCNGDGCRARNHCYRFTATPSVYVQSWFVQTPCDNKKCDYYYEMEVDKMFYNVIDAETGEIYVNNETVTEATKFLIDYECRIVGAPDFLTEDQRSDEDIYVILYQEVM